MLEEDGRLADRLFEKLEASPNFAPRGGLGLPGLPKFHDCFQGQQSELTHDTECHPKEHLHKQHIPEDRRSQSANARQSVHQHKKQPVWSMGSGREWERAGASERE